MDSRLEVVGTIYENNCQRIVECIDTKTDEKYIYNTIISQNLINLIDITLLNSLSSNIVKAYTTDDRLYIVTKPYSSYGQYMIKDYINIKKISLKQQFCLTEQLINLCILIENASDLLQYKILSINNLCIKNDEKLIVNGYFEFKDEFDISDNFTYKNLGNIIHYIFSGEEIVDYNLSDNIPPDITKIIVKCLTREYFSPKDILKELINSPIYGMIYCKVDGPSTISKLSEASNLSSVSLPVKEFTNGVSISDTDEKILKDLQYPAFLEDEPKNNKTDVPNNQDIQNNQNNQNSYDIQDTNDTQDNQDTLDKSNELDEKDIQKNDDGLDSVANQSVIDIYLNRVEEKKQEHIEKSSHGKVFKIVIPICVVVVGIFMVFLLKNLYTKTDVPVSEKISNESQNEENNKSNSSDDQKKDNNVDPEDSDKVAEKLDKSIFLNSELLKKINYTGNYAQVSTENYNEGNSSFVVENNDDNSVKSLFAVIDFTSEDFRLLQNNTITLSAMFKSEKDVEAKLIVEAYKDGKLTTDNSGKFNIFDDVWVVKTANVIVGDMDRLNLYVEFVGKNKVWVDSISADIQK